MPLENQVAVTPASEKFMFSRTVSSEEKTPDKVRALIKKNYGIEPAKTLDKMLYKRVAKGKTFYKTADGRFGLIEFKSTTEEMRLPNTAA